MFFKSITDLIYNYYLLKNPLFPKPGKVIKKLLSSKFAMLNE